MIAWLSHGPIGPFPDSSATFPPKARREWINVYSVSVGEATSWVWVKLKQGAIVDLGSISQGNPFWARRIYQASEKCSRGWRVALGSMSVPRLVREVAGHPAVCGAASAEADLLQPGPSNLSRAPNHQVSIGAYGREHEDRVGEKYIDLGQEEYLARARNMSGVLLGPNSATLTS